jgi:glycerol uptake facilitator-like aquaporin
MFEKYIVETFATALFVYVILSTGNPLAIGACLALIILVAQSISGGYVNPAVAIIMASAGQLPMNDVLPYCLAEIFGALIALEIYKRVQ